ncbi:hypothetical protein PBRA_004149 [Plasmodiophora brassicae]|uniref:Uncharacterized protein n=1 Tax=Plasmodiophora brassicae TaxID=37360 RepID=A0A0G4IJP1_PLABS|nr:hypothetical protein PBRA_004149 [Plasmodiophora brassicae]
MSLNALIDEASVAPPGAVVFIGQWFARAERDRDTLERSGFVADSPLDVGVAQDSGGERGHGISIAFVDRDPAR